MISTDENVNKQYKQILRICIGPEMNELIWKRS